MKTEVIVLGRNVKAIILGDAMIPYNVFIKAWNEHLSSILGKNVVAGNFEENWEKLQYRRLEVEKYGPEIEEVDELIIKEGNDAEIILGLFVPLSKKVMDAMPNLRIIGVSRAGLENVNVEEATKRGILVFNVLGRNAHAVSDFTIGLMLAEARNIARAHYSIKNGEWRKTFANSDYIPELRGKTVGLVGLGHIGRLVAKKLSGFDVNIITYDPYVSDEVLEEAGVKRVELNELFEQSDFVSVHARLTDENKQMIGVEQLNRMKKTAIFINTGRAGLVDYDALAKVLKERKILGAALDVFTTEPIPQDSPLLELDNVTLTTHIAGTTADALNNSPFMLTEDIAKFLKDENPRFIVNPEVLEDKSFKQWLDTIL